MILLIMADIGSLSKMVITGNAYIAELTYDAASILMQTAMLGKLLIKSIIAIIIIVRVANVIK